MWKMPSGGGTMVEKRQVPESAFSGTGFRKTVESLMVEVEELYTSDSIPWVIGYSGGKDSTAVLQLVWMALQRLTKSQLTKPVYVISTDTLVENPIVSLWVSKSLDKMGEVAVRHELPLTAHKLTPATESTFWVNLIGRGYPAPRPKFRWCTERLKINPSTRFISSVVQEHGEAILVLGTRKAESAARAKVMERFEKGRMRDRLSPNGSLPNSFVYSPIEDWTNDDVWMFLMQVANPWGYNNKDLADDVPRGDSWRRMPARRRYQHAELRGQSVRLLGLHACRKGQVDAGHDPERRREGVDASPPGTAQRAGSAQDGGGRQAPARLPPDERSGSAFQRPAHSRSLQARVYGKTGCARYWSHNGTSGNTGPRKSVIFSSSRLRSLRKFAVSGSSRSMKSKTAFQVSTRALRVCPTREAVWTTTLSWARRRWGSCGKLCGEDELHFQLTRELLSIEKQHKSMLRRAGLFNAIEQAFHRSFYDGEEDAVARARERRDSLDMARKRRTLEDSSPTVQEGPRDLFALDKAKR